MSPPRVSGAAAPDRAEAYPVSQLLHDLDELRRARSENGVRLLHEVEGIRERHQRACVRLLQQLTPHLHAARAVERELDRHLARRFNVFRYLREDELGLSRIIADLLDPDTDHCQGTTFLEAMMELLGVAPEATDSDRHGRAVSGGRSRTTTWKEHFDRLLSNAGDKIRVVPERGLPDGKRIDITVDIPTDDGPFCLAFENKPYADDQPGQCRDYLEFLGKLYGERFLLVYLPPRYRMPDESSLSLADRERWRSHFRVLPYVADDAPIGDDDPSDGDGAATGEVPFDADDAFPETVGEGTSLADWFGTCCKLSDAERLRWFLREAQLFCRQHFGDSTMTDTEARYIHEYLDANPRHLHAAFAVARAWPVVKHDVCRRFLEHLRDRVGERLREVMPDKASDLDVGCHYGEDEKWSNYMWVYRCGWVRCPSSVVRSGGRTAMMLECGTGGPTSWKWGVRSPKHKNDMTAPEEKRREEVEGALRRHGLSLPHGGGHWPQHGSPRYQNWSVIVPELAQELADGGGKITDHYVNGLIEIAEKAIPAIDEVELENMSPSGSGDS